MHYIPPAPLLCQTCYRFLIQSAFADCGTTSASVYAVSVESSCLTRSMLCCVPDLIMAVDSQTGEPVTTESLHYGYRVTILGMPCNGRWRTPEGIALGGAGYCGVCAGGGE